MQTMNRVWRTVAVVALTGIAASACSSGGGSHPTVALEAARAVHDPFTTSVHYESAPPSTAPATLPPVTAAQGNAPQRVSGTAPGLYGGTRDLATCDIEQMVAFLTTHAAQAKAWADAQSIPVGQIPDYLRALTPVVLRVDTRVVNHGFKGGKANGFEAVLETGTAVLIDNRGVPRAKCACGNPLTPSALGTQAVDYSGQPWNGFSDAKVTTVTAGQPVDSFQLVDGATGDTFSRPVGGNGTSDQAAPAGDNKEYTGTGPGDIDVSSGVPFVVTSSVALDGSESGYFAEKGDKLQHAGAYKGLHVMAAVGEAWRVVVRPLGPKYKTYTGHGDTTLGTPDIHPSGDVVTELLYDNPNNQLIYLNGANGLVDEFAAVHVSDLGKLTVGGGTDIDWTLNLWGLPAHCGFLRGTSRSVICGD